MFVRLFAMLAATAAAQGVADGTCSLQSGCPWDKVDFRCLSGGRGILSVVYQQITHYSGAVACGNLFLEKDIGGGINTPPFVAFEQAQADKLYTLIMIDPDADLPNSTSFPDAAAAGSHAPVRHWVAGNIEGNALLKGDLSAALIVSPFHGASPPWGSHRYGQFLFEQKGHLDFVVYPPSVSIAKWDYAAFIANYSLGEPVASNWHVTMHTE